MRHPVGFCVIAIGLAVAACGCAPGAKPAPPASSAASDSAVPTESNPPGDIPDTQVFVAWSPPGGGYTVKVPEGWSRTAHGPATVFADTFNSVRAERRTAAAPPTVASVQSRDLPVIKAKSPGFALVTVATMVRKGGRAVLAEYRANSAPDPVTGKSVPLDVQRYAFYRSGKGEVVLTLSGAVGADNVDPWRTVTDSFRWT
jgi:hypothetical protein